MLVLILRNGSPRWLPFNQQNFLLSTQDRDVVNGLLGDSGVAADEYLVETDVGELVVGDALGGLVWDADDVVVVFLFGVPEDVAGVSLYLLISKRIRIYQCKIILP